MATNKLFEAAAEILSGTKGKNAMPMEKPEGAEIHDAGGPTPQNAKPDDDSHKITPSSKSATAPTTKPSDASAEMAKKTLSKEESEVEGELLDVSSDIDAMFADSAISEEFRSKVTTIFEARVQDRISQLEEETEARYASMLEEAVESVKEDLTEKVNDYLSYVVEQWIADNEIAIEKGLRAELTEDFIAGLKNLFVEHYIDVPSDKVDLVEELASKVEELEGQLKMSFHYWRNQGQVQKTRFITLENSYHGETLGALAVGNVPLYKETYAPLLMDVITVPGPDCYYREAGESWADYSIRRFALMERTLQNQCHTVSAVIIEPLVQCAGNMRMYDPVYLKLLREACDKYNVHLIADEIAVGFGRTGTLFACEQATISPDFMCLSKGLTGGYLPLSAVLTTTQVYQAFYDDYQNMTAFLHSHSYTGNALACRAALATIDIFQQQNIIQKNKRLASVMTEMAKRFNEHLHVSEVRQTGMILAIEMVKDKNTREPYLWQERRGLKVYQYALSKGVLLRPLGNVIYFMPPYIVTEDELMLIAEIAWQGIEHAVRD